MTSFYIVRTTLNLADDALRIMREYSDRRSITLGEAASELVRRGSAAHLPTRMVDGFVVFDVPASGGKITSERVRELLDSE